MSHIRVRFAPSPTGYLHVGGARTLFFNWLFAKKNNGTLILRVEDTDQNRSTRASEQMILSDVQRLGIDYQEGPDLGGKYAPYRQSERLNLYAAYARKLLDEDRVYYCFCTDELLTQKRETAMKLGRTPHYDGTCSRLPQDEVKMRLARGERAGLRFRAPQQTYVLNDLVKGKIEFKEGMVGDFFVTRSPGKEEKEIAEGIGFPVYNFCCVIDDYLMEMSHIIRAEEHLSNTVRQLMIFEAFGWTPPQYAHSALVLGTDRQKLSKRTGDVSVCEYLEKGYLPEALLNFLVLLGWWPPSEIKPVSGHPEILSIDEMISHFSLDGLQKSPGVFDIQKLNWMNSYYLRHSPVKGIAAKAKPFFEKNGNLFMDRSEGWFEKMIETVRSEAIILSDLPKVAKDFFETIPPLEDDAKMALQETASKAVVDALESVLKSNEGELTEAEVDLLPKKVGAVAGVKGKALFMPLRAVITGKTHGPELKQILPLLGRDAVLRRAQELRKQAGI